MAALVALVAAGGAACSGDDGGGSGDGGAGQPDGQALAAAFGDAAEAAYDERGGDRAEDFNEGVVLDGDCFALDGGGVDAIAEALGLDPQDVEIGRGTFLNGNPDRQEILTCPLGGGGGRDRISFTAGRVSYDRDGLLEQLRESADPDEGPVEEIEGEAPGLAGDQVLAVSRNGGETVAYAWVADGFAVTLAFLSEVADPDTGFAALSEAVDAVATTLR